MTRRPLPPLGLLPALGVAALLGAWSVDARAGEPTPATATAPTLAARIASATLTPAVDTPIPLGTPITLALTVEHPLESRLIPPEVMPNPRWEVIKQDRTLAPGASGEATQRTTLLWTFLMGRPGKTTLPPLSIDVRGAGGAQATLTTAPITAHITSVLPPVKPGADPPALAPPQPPLAITRTDYTTLYIAIAALLVALLAIVAAWMWRRRAEHTLPSAPPQPSHIVAREALLAIEREGVIARGELVEATVRMSEIVRTYLGKRFGFPGAELTTTELLQRMRRARLPADVSLDDIHAWLDETDYIKFSKRAEPDATTTAAALQRALSLVELTRPRQDALEAVADAATTADDAQGDDAPQDDAPGDDPDDSSDALIADGVLPAHPALLAAARAAARDDDDVEVDDADDADVASGVASDATHDETPDEALDVDDVLDEVLGHEVSEADSEADSEAEDDASPVASATDDTLQAPESTKNLEDIRLKKTDDLADTTPAQEAP